MKKFIKLFHPKFDVHQSVCTIYCWGHVQESDALMAGGVPHWEAFVGFSADVHPSETIALSCFQSKKSTLCYWNLFPLLVKSFCFVILTKITCAEGALQEKWECWRFFLHALIFG